LVKTGSECRAIAAIAAAIVAMCAACFSACVVCFRFFLYSWVSPLVSTTLVVTSAMVWARYRFWYGTSVAAAFRAGLPRVGVFTEETIFFAVSGFSNWATWPRLPHLPLGPQLCSASAPGCRHCLDVLLLD